jgi:hypothetical protein
MSTSRIIFPATLVIFAMVAGSGESVRGFQADDFSEQKTALTDASFAAWRDRIRVQESELAWQDLPWLTSFHDGLREAAAQHKPLLLWAMNGHPLGCT